jgi:lysophospholipase L1-like esterase
MKLRSILGVFLMTALLGLASATAKDRTSNSGEYLALGDSAVFPFLQGAGYEYFYPTNFVGYADWTGLALGLTTVNASCPGETTSSYLTIQFSNGCIQYRFLFGLHVDYPALDTTQSDFATAFLEQHSDVALLTIQVGANDLSLLEQQCADNEQYEQCITNGAPQVFAKAQANMQTALAQLRDTGYSGPIVIVNYYSVDYTNQFLTQLIVGLNQAITAAAPAYGAVVADVFSAFKAAAMGGRGRGDTCKAGLLNGSNPVTNPASCDIHASQSGHKLIAQTIEDVYQPLAGKANR